MLKNILTILLLGLALTSCGQTKAKVEQSGNFKALARLISFEGGDKIYVAKFKIIKNLSDILTQNDTVLVGFYNYKPPEINLDTVLLTLKKDGGKTSVKNYFICPDNDGKQGIKSTKIDFIDFAYWEACETGKGDCQPLTITRPKAEKNWYLMMPCGGTETAISITGQNFNKKLHLHHDNCPPYLDLTNLNDGQYFATMIACGLGGTVQFNLTTN